MIFKLNHIHSQKNLFLLLYCFIILLVCAYLYKKPAYNWDILPYMGVILAYENNNTNTIHETVYNTAEKQIPLASYKQLTDSSNLYRKKIAESANEFYLQFPFYVVKPLYTRLSWILYKSGISLSKATVLPSLAAYFLITFLLYS